LCRAERSARVKAAVGMCSFACEERRRRMSVMAEVVGMVVEIILSGADGGSLGLLSYLALWVLLLYARRLAMCCSCW
jgi:hypothetical protein